MKFKEFVAWCNERACDGCWGMNTAVSCIEVMNEVRKQPFWKREKVWQEKYADFYTKNIVEVINNKIKEMYGNEN